MKGVEEAHMSKGTAAGTNLASDSTGNAFMETPSLNPSEALPDVELLKTTNIDTEIPESSSLKEGELEKGTLPPQGVMVKVESLDEGLGMECSKNGSTGLDLSSGTTAPALPSRTFFLTSVELNQEDRYLNGLKEPGQGLDGDLLDREGPAGVGKEKTKLVPSQRFKVKISTMAGQDLGPFESRSQHKADGLLGWQGESVLSQLPLDLSLLHGKKETRQGPADRGEEADEEEDDTEDSDESDEELCCYNIQEPSEDSEEEPVVAPIVIAESHSARNLRSLLKMPGLVPHSFCEDCERKKKVVSFFDDVTVYLFDQESPTKDLGEQDFPAVPDSCPVAISPMDRLNASDDSSDGNASEESGGFEWDDDFPLMPVAPSFTPSLTSVGSALPDTAAAQKQVLPIHFSRFTVSPAAVSRFSITHVSDSDMESAGGSSEDGERE